MKKLDDFYKAHAPFTMKEDENSFGKVMLKSDYYKGIGTLY